MIRSSYLNTKTSISSVLGSEYTEPANEDEKQLRNEGIVQNVDKIYEEFDDIENESIDDNYLSQELDDDSEKENSGITFSPFCEKVTRKKELPTPLFAGNKFLSFLKTIKNNFSFLIVFADARQKIEDPIGRYFTESNLYRLWSFMALPVTLPIDLTYAVTKRYENIFNRCQY